MPDIRLEGVTKLYPNGVAAVRDVSLTIPDGEFMVLLGPSGCGKSTTLRMIAGLEAISKGDLVIGGRRMNEVDPKDRDLAFVFQNYALFAHMTVRGNLTFGMRIRKVPAPEQERRLAEVAPMLGLEELLDRKPGQLSGGQRQRVALGRALLREPVAFLLDEPLSNLDAKLRATMRTELVKLHRKVGRTIIHVTHDQVEAMTMAERICIMHEGRVVQVGAPLEVYRNPASTFVAGFLASPPMNLLPARLEAAEGGLRVEAPGISIPLPAAETQAYAGHAGQPVTLGLRPEDLQPRAYGRDPAAIEVGIVAVEALGPEVILVAAPDGGPELAARVAPEVTPPAGSRLPLHIEPARLRLFEATSGRAIPPPRA